jgi:hypothetical protein
MWNNIKLFFSFSLSFSLSICTGQIITMCSLLPVLKYDAKLKYFRGNKETDNTKIQRKKTKNQPDGNRENRKPISLKTDLWLVFGLLKTDSVSVSRRAVLSIH